MKNLLLPISGFPEFLPEDQIVFNWAKAIIAEAYEAIGAVPIETPAVERTDVLLSKGGDNKEVYGIHRIAGDEDDKKELGLHFDLTVPLARYVSQWQNDLVFPFKRYAIQPVWRGERAQAGRYRQFYQCDVDVVGKDSLSLLYDAEMPYVIYKIFTKMNIGDFTININNRKIQMGFFENLGLNPVQSTAVVKIIDKYFGFNSSETFASTEKCLLDEGLLQSQANQIINFFERTENLNSDETLRYLSSTPSLGGYAKQGINELATVFEHMTAMGLNRKNMAVNLKIARGLDYYTGSVYETKLESNPALGSICSGGRYDNLTQYFSKQVMPGVGISIGLTRLIPELIRTNVLKATRKTVAEVLVTNAIPARTADYVKLAASLRDAGIKTEVYLEDRKLVKQVEFANKKGVRFIVIEAEAEIAGGFITIKNMDTGEQAPIPTDQVVTYLKHQLSAPAPNPVLN